MNRRKLAAYGQEFEDEDEDGTSVSKKPTQIHEEIATDERGKRRFHGAFTGGFSAGYWNTVGSKHGWVPQVFSSSRDSRGDKIKQRAEDFMDAEDLGEFGIGNRSIKQTAAFGESGQKRKMAWERDSSSVSAITQLFEDVVKPVSNSIGVHMLRTMGWRQGRGIGLANVKQKQQRGGHSTEAQFDRDQAAQVAPAYEFANEDAIVQQLTPLTGTHGLGYQGLRQTTVLDESYGRTALALTTGKKASKGIKGQAFGVGAFEDEDESVYSNYDLSQFDFSLDVTGKGEATDLKTQKIDTAFELQPKRLNPRKFYAPPRVPPNFRGDHRPIPMDVSRLPQMMRDDVKQMTAVQRAKFLGEDRVSALEIGGKDAKKEVKERRSRWDIKADEVEKREHERGGEADEDRERRLRNRVEFPDEPMRQARFKEFLHYLRRGLPYPQPTDLTVWEWEWEKKEFESKLTSEERSMLPEVRSRSQPLAKTSIAAPMREAMAAKFVKESGGDLKVGQKDEDKLAAVKMDMFGERTRQSFEWYPDSLLAKRFNVPHPFPGSDIVGVPALQKNNFRRNDTLADVCGVVVGLPNTANEVEMRERLLKSRARRNAEDKQQDDEKEQYEDADKGAVDSDEEVEVKKEEKAPKSFFDTIFGDGADESSSSEEEDSEDEREAEKRREEAIRKRKEEWKMKEKEKEKKEEEERKKIGEEWKKMKEKQEERKKEEKGNEEEEIQIIEEKTKVATNYGPALPPIKTMSSARVLELLKKDMERKKEEKTRKKDKKKDKKKEKKAKKSKKNKKEKRKRRDSSDDSDDSEDGWEEKK